MATIKLQIESNASESVAVINQLSDSTAELNSETKAYGVVSQKAFASATNEVDDLNKEIKTGTQQTEKLAEGAKAVGASANKIKQLKDEIKTLKSEAALAGEGTAKFAENLKKAGALQDELDGLNDSLKAVAKNAGENVTGALGEIVNIGVSGFEGVTAASSLLGLETEEVEKQILKLTQLRALSNVAKEFADIGGKINEIKLGLSPLTSAFKDNISNIADGYSSANKSVGDFFKNFGPNVSNAVKGLGGNVKGFFTNFGSNAKGLFTSLSGGIKGFVSSAVSGFKTLGATIAANPLGLILVVVGAIIGVLVVLKDKVKPIAVVFEALGKVISGIADGVEALAQSLGLVASEGEKNAEETIKNTEKEVEAISKRYDREIKLAKASGKETREIEQDKLKAEGTRIAKSIAQLEYLKKVNGQLNEEQLKEYEKLNNQLLDIRTDLTASVLEKQTEERKKQEENAKKAKENAQKNAEERKKLQADLDSALLELSKKSEQALLNALSGEERLKKQREINLREVQELEATLIKKGQLLKKDFQLTVEQQQELANIRNTIEKDFNDNLFKLQAERATKTAEAQKKEVDDELKLIELKAELATKSIEATEPPKGATKDAEIQFELQKQEAILNIKKQAVLDSLEVKKRSIDAEANLSIVALNNELIALKGKEDAVSRARAEAIEKEKQAILDNANISKEIVVKETQSTVNAINKELGQIGDKTKVKPVNFGKLLGGDTGEIVQFIKLKAKVDVDPASVEAAKQAISQMFDAIKSIVADAFEIANQQLDQQLKISDQVIAQRDKNISDLESQLNAETELRNQGLANNTDAVLKAIEEEKAARQAELEQRRKIQEEKKKLAKQQLIIDTALGASQLVLAIAQLFSALSSFTIGPVPVGLIIAIASSAAMIGAFVAGKAKAFQAVNSQPAGGFAKGGYTGDMPVTSEAGVVHGREFVMNADKTDKYYDLFQGIHTDDKALMKRGLLDLLEGTGVELPQTIGQDIKTKKDSIRGTEIRLMSNHDNSGVESRLDNLENHLKQLVKQGNEKEIPLANGDIMIKKGSSTTIRKR